jgi:cytochrome c556
MKKIWLAGFAVLAMGVSTMAFAQGDIIAARRAGLKRMGDHMTAMKAVADVRAPGPQFVGTIEEMIAFFQGLQGRFPPGTETGGETKALPTIWSDPVGFNGAAAEAVSKLQALRVAAAGGDGAAFEAAWKAVGPTCGACHRTYRAR